MLNTADRRLLLVLFSGAAVLSVAAAPPAPAEDAVREARAGAMKAALEGINADLQKYGGGSWQKWGEANTAYREAAAKLLTPAIEWPWPAKHNFVFQGAAIRLLLADTLDNRPEGERPFDAIAAFDKHCKARGIDLIFVPLPDKVAIYGDYLEAAADAPPKAPLCTAVKHLMKRLLEADVEVVDLYPDFLAHRRKHGEDLPLYYDRDSHWRSRAAQLAAERVAERLKRYDFVQQALAEGNRYSTQAEFRKDKADDIVVVLDAKTGKRYADVKDSPVLITGDSNLMYNMGPTGGHLPAHVARHIGLPLTFVAPSGGDAPEKTKGRLAGRRVVIWAQIARALMGKWPVVDLAPAANERKR